MHAEETTAEAPPRWQGSAAVPSPPPRKRRWLETAHETAQPPPHPTHPLPPDELDDEEAPTPVDPWAGADLWGPLPAYPPAPEYPPTRPYPVEHPQSPAGPPRPAAPAGAPPGTQAPPPPTFRAGPPGAAPPAVRPHPPGPPAVQPGTRPEPGRKIRRWGRRRSPYDRPQAPPPGWRPPPGYVPVPVRRRRKWPWLLLLTLVCCCGIPAYLGGPMAQQYPATAALPAQVADLSLRNDPASERTAQRLEREMQATYWAEDTFAGIYSAANGKRAVVFGATGFRFTPDQDVDAEISRLREAYELRDIRAIDSGTRGEHRRCGIGRWNGDSVVVCTWADHGSIASAVFDRLSVDDSARLLDELRSSIISRG